MATYLIVLPLAVLLAAAVWILWLVLQTRRIAGRAEQLVPAAGRFVDVDGNRLHCVDEGQGRPIVFIHGLGGQLHHFRHTLFPALAQEYRLIALDRPGSGYSSRAAGVATGPRAQARTIADFIQTLGLERPLIVGHSLGGAVSLALAQDFPERVGGVALLAPLGVHNLSEARDFSPLNVSSPFRQWLLANTIAVPASLKAAQATLDYIFAPQQAASDYMVEAGGWLGLRPSHIRACYQDYVAIGTDMAEIQRRLPELTMPVGIVFGKSDRVLPYEQYGAPLQQALPSADFEALEGIGHMPQFAATDICVAFVRRMAERVGRL